VVLQYGLVLHLDGTSDSSQVMRVMLDDVAPLAAPFTPHVQISDCSLLFWYEWNIGAAIPRKIIGLGAHREEWLKLAIPSVHKWQGSVGLGKKFLGIFGG